MKTNELPEDVKAKINDAVAKIYWAMQIRFPLRTVYQVHEEKAGAIAEIYRLGLQSREEEIGLLKIDRDHERTLRLSCETALASREEQLKEMELKWQVDKSGVLNFTSNLAKHKKDEEILKLTDNVEKLLLQFKRDGATIDSLTKENERLREGVSKIKEEIFTRLEDGDVTLGMEGKQKKTL